MKIPKSLLTLTAIVALAGCDNTPQEEPKLSDFTNLPVYVGETRMKEVNDAKGNIAVLSLHPDFSEKNSFTTKCYVKEGFKQSLASYCPPGAIAPLTPQIINQYSALKKANQELTLGFAHSDWERSKTRYTAKTTNTN